MIVPPDELLELAPELDLVGATRLLRLAIRAVTAYLWPAAIPSPLPPPLELIILELALRAGRASTDTAGAVVSESLGAYTYRLQAPLPLDMAIGIPGDLAALLAPWSPSHRRVYELDTTYGSAGPPGWLGVPHAGAFERDLDNDDPELAGGQVATS